MLSRLLTITTQQTAALSKSTRQAIITLCTAAHGHDFSALFTFLLPDALHVLGYWEQELVSHAVVTTRWLQPEGLPILRTAFIDAVATAPIYQGQGLGSALMRCLATVIPEYTIACLQTERVSFYAHVGWELWRGGLAGRGEHGLIPTPAQQGVMILRLPQTPPLDLDSLLTIESQLPARIWE